MTRRTILLLSTPLLFCMTLAAAWLVWRGVSELRYDVGRGVLDSLDTGPQASLIYDRHGKLAHSLFTEQRTDVALDRISPHMIDAVVAAEDRRFYEHIGVDPVRIVGAALANVKARRIVQGGSTITQQLARHIERDRHRTWGRKIREVFTAADLEARHTKGQILEAYLNTAYYGEGYYGVEAASRGYFGKPASALTPEQAALLAGLVRAPSANSPNKNPKGATTVRNLVLRAMHEHGALAEGDMRRFLAAPVVVRKRQSNGLTGHSHGPDAACGLYYFEEVRLQLIELFGEEQVLEGGLRVFTMYDTDVQRSAERSIAQRVAQIGGQRGELQGALVAMEPRTGHVLALVGGRDFHASSYNRATQALRQPGSAFKPFVWAAAIERGWTPSTMLTGLDMPIGDGTWMPEGGANPEGYTLRQALVVSSNRAAAHLMQQVGMSSTLYTAQRMGIESALPAVPSLALGTGEVTLFEMVAAFGAFANEGTWTRPSLITRVEDNDGHVVWTAPLEQRRALSTGAAYLMNSMLSDVVDRGTGWRARQAGFSLPAAGKTGTSDDYADSWFIGYTPNIVAGVWFGYDQRKRIMKANAGDIAVPAWASFMRAATRGDKPVWYSMPSDIEKVEICRASGYRAGEACRRSSGFARVVTIDGEMVERQVPAGVVTELFRLGTAPYGECPIHGGLYLDASNIDPSMTLPPLPLPAVSATDPALQSGIGVLAPPTPVATTGPPSTSSAPSLGSVARPGLPKLPGTAVKTPAGMKIERIAKPDGTVIIIIKDHR